MRKINTLEMNRKLQYIEHNLKTRVHIIPNLRLVSGSLPHLQVGARKIYFTNFLEAEFLNRRSNDFPPVFQQFGWLWIVTAASNQIECTRLLPKIHRFASIELHLLAFVPRKISQKDFVRSGH